jgi:hypothetical protein
MFVLQYNLCIYVFIFGLKQNVQLVELLLPAEIDFSDPNVAALMTSCLRYVPHSLMF